MMKKLQEDEERRKRIILVGDYVSKTGSSTRNTAKYFTENFFSISNFTVSEYLKLYLKINPEEKNNIYNIIESNIPKSIEDEKIKNRVITASNMILNGYTIEETAKELDSSFWETYRDIHYRLKKIDEDKYALITQILKKHSNENARKK